MHSVVLTQILNNDRKNKNSFQELKSFVMQNIEENKIPITEIGEIPIQYLDMTKLPGVPSQNVMTPSTVYKPFRYDFGFEIWHRQNQIHWLHSEVSFDQDAIDWSSKMSKQQKNLATHIFPLFVQNDFLVNNAYLHQYARIFLPNEIQMAIGAIANTESIHQVSYATLLDTLGFDEGHYSAFMKYKEMSDKYDFTAGFRMDSLMGIAVAMLVFGCLTEGVQLFASFAMLFNYSRFNLLKGMGQIVSLSVRDESLHVEFVSRLFRVFIHEFGHLIDKNKLREIAYSAARQIVENEHLFIDLAFELGPVPGMTPEETKQYICSVADWRLSQFGYDPIYNVENPLAGWINQMMGGIEHANFFETRSTEYSKAATTGTWEEAFA